MSKEFQEPEEKNLNNTDDAIIMDDFNPLGEAVNEKEYTKHNVKVNPNDFRNPIPEPSFTPPPMTGMVNESDKPKDIKPKEPFNPQAREMTSKEKKLGSKRVAEMMMTAYKWINKLADSSLQFSETKVSKLNLTATIIDPRVAWFTTGAAILLLLGAVAQSVRRVRRSRHEK